MTRMGNAVRGRGSSFGPAHGGERGELAPRQVVVFWCCHGHETVRSFADDVVAPPEWECPQCGCLAGHDKTNPPPKKGHEPFKTHLAYVRERRTEADGEAILAEALERLRQRRGRGQGKS